MEHFGFKATNGNPLILPLVTDSLVETTLVEEPAVKYHANHHWMSQSALKVLRESPKHFIHELAKYQGGEKEDKDAFRFGTAAHLAILEPQLFRKRFVAQPDFGDLRVKANRNSRDAWKSEQDSEAVILDSEEMEKLTAMILEVQKTTGKLFEKGLVERSIYFRDEATSIQCKCRPDLITEYDRGPLIVDFKTTRDIEEAIFSKDMKNYGYLVQLAFYADAASKILGYDVDCAIVAVEKEPPFDCAIYILNDDDVEYGRQWYKWALNLYRTCYTLGKWPGKAGKPREIRLPRSVQFETFPEFEF